MTAVVALGANLGDRLGALRAAVALLQPFALSSVYETVPVGGPDQPAFLNAVVLTELTAAQAWAVARRAEQAADRSRAVRWGPRTLDVDVIWAEGVDPDLQLPHPRAADRAFVLVPWLEVDPGAVLVGHGPVRDLLGRTDLSGVRRRADLGWA